MFSAFATPLIDKPAQASALKPYPDTYSDFSGFGFRNFSRPGAVFSDGFESP